MSLDYKNTLHMPQTNFEMRANLVQKEADFRKLWIENEIYQKALAKNNGKKSFILHDGPPYANGDLHIGHALNKILKDIIVRFKTLDGFYSPYVPGWDMHGLPIEHKMLQLANQKHTDIDVVQLRKNAAQYAKSQVLIQKEQFLQLQLFSDFKLIYETIDPKFEASQLRLFKKMFFDKLIYKGLKPVFWSPSSLSALAEAEVEYLEKHSPSIYVALKVTKGNDFVKQNENLVIWTTTPWTLIANAGVAVSKDIDYVKIVVDDQIYVVAELLIQNFVKLLNKDYSQLKISKSFKGNELINIEYEHPLGTANKIPKVVLGHHVDITAGTGLVHMAPLFGEDDFLISRNEGLEEIMHINDDGHINALGKKYETMFYEKANKVIIEDLIQTSKLVYSTILIHQYPHDWRTNKPIIFRGTPQWFVSIEKIKDGLLKSLEDVQGTPYWVIKRLGEMIAKRGPWTISRQRSWGVPIPIFYDKNEKIVEDETIFDHIISLVEKNGTDIWFQLDADELLPQNHRNKGYTKEMSIMDVWFDSGSTNIAVKVDGQNQDDNETPFDIYLEGTDQFRGWFNSSLINSYAWRKKSPYKFLLSHGFALDGKGQKMSKSKGNVILPSEVISTLGADVLRLWVASVEYSSDVSISKDILKQVGETYRKIRNTIRFLLANLSDYDHDKKIVLTGIHALINERLNVLKNKIIDYYNNYQFSNLTKAITNYLVDLSGFYLSYAKDILYADKIDSNQRRQIQFNMFETLDAILLSLAPILPTTTEEAYKLFNKKDKKESIHLEDIFKKVEVKTNFEQQWEEFFALKDKVFKSIEQLIADKKIKRSNEVFVTIEKPSKIFAEQNLAQLLMVAQVNFGSNLETKILQSNKCPRCWNHHLDNNIDNLCNRCQELLGK